MKGVVFNIVEEVVTDGFGEDAWEQMLDHAGSDGVFTALGTYDDAIMVRLVTAAATLLHIEVPDVLRTVGRAGYPLLAGRYPRLVERYASARDLLMDLEDVIHPQVLALNPGAIVPHFEASEDGGAVRLVYRSARGMCHLAEGLALGAGDAFDEDLVVEQVTCVHVGDPECVIVATPAG